MSDEIVEYEYGVQYRMSGKDYVEPVTYQTIPQALWRVKELLAWGLTGEIVQRTKSPWTKVEEN